MSGIAETGRPETDRVVELIDDVIEWHGSGDAMCWTAEPPKDLAPWTQLTEDELAERRRQIDEGFRQLRELFHGWLEAVKPAFEEMGKALHDACRAMQPVIEARAEYRRHLHTSYRQRSLSRRRRRT